MDLPHQRMILTESPETKTPYEFDMSGMFLTAGGDGFHKFNVLSVVDGGPAASAGIKPGDVIVELDGKSASKLTLEQLRLCTARSRSDPHLVDRTRRTVGTRSKFHCDG